MLVERMVVVRVWKLFGVKHKLLHCISAVQILRVLTIKV